MVKEENGQGANATSKIFDKGTATVPIEKGINVEACYAPKFLSNIISVGFVQKNVEVEFSESIRKYPGCFLVEKGK